MFTREIIYIFANVTPDVFTINNQQIVDKKSLFLLCWYSYFFNFGQPYPLQSQHLAILSFTASEISASRTTFFCFYLFNLKTRAVHVFFFFISDCVNNTRGDFV